MIKKKTMASLVKEYLEYRRNLGYQLRSSGDHLFDFADYADKLGHRGTFTVDLALQWASLLKEASPSSGARRLEVIRPFAKYLAIFDSDMEIPPAKILGSVQRRTPPHIYSQKEIAELMKAARTFIPLDGLRPRTYETLFGLLACTGIRISEALRLTRDDVDLKNGLLTIRETKFLKSRLVPLHPSATKALKRYTRFRNNYHPSAESNAFFLTEWGDPLCYSTVRSAFRKIRHILGWDIRDGTRMPRIHDLRHTFACQRLLQWYRDGIDIERHIHALYTYLGHVCVSSTYWYLTGTPELLAESAARFDKFANEPVKGDEK